MRIAFATDDLSTISAHPGRARMFLVINFDEAGQITAREARDKPVHGPHEHHGHEHHDHHNDHDSGFFARMSAVISDCQLVVARGMGQPAFTKFQAAGVEPLLTELAGIDEALAAWQAGRLTNRPNRVH